MFHIDVLFPFVRNGFLAVCEGMVISVLKGRPAPQRFFDAESNFWFRGLSCQLKNKFQTAQNKIIRYVFNHHSRKHIGFEDFDKIGMLNVKYRVDYISLCHMYNVFTGNAPSYFCNIIDVTNHSHSTRSQSHFILPHVKGQGKKSFKFNGIRLWNQLPSSIRSCDSKENFKKQLKQDLMLRMKNEEDCDFVC